MTRLSLILSLLLLTTHPIPASSNHLPQKPTPKTKRSAHQPPTLVLRSPLLLSIGKASINLLPLLSATAIVEYLKLAVPSIDQDEKSTYFAIGEHIIRHILIIYTSYYFFKLFDKKNQPNLLFYAIISSVGNLIAVLCADYICTLCSIFLATPYALQTLVIDIFITYFIIKSFQKKNAKEK